MCCDGSCTLEELISADLNNNKTQGLSRVVIIGHSAGGHLALWLASRVNKLSQNEIGDILQIPIKGVISLAGVSDLKKMWEIDAQKGLESPVANFIGGRQAANLEDY